MNKWFELDHILKVITPLVEKDEPYWGYEEKLNITKEIYKLNNYLLTDDEIIIETYFLITHGKNNQESNTEETQH